ncbi:hypothetical protein KC19_4G197800 [Ceratodon purpureus]|uniref:TIR domain-containing protein n=1 Tax=Ceratodon purpureus TaxID=3225 RepID=A0A8T0ICV4_CERPU|nr:hypothetical protein KC19_4G197800 [Ceratodon purpureus]
MEPSSKRLNLERANNSESINVGDFSKTVETDDGMSSTDSCRNPKCNHVLEHKHKIFLSHSGAQKDFVEQLCIDLEGCDRYPFFDKRQCSLPIVEEFPKRIFDAIRQCQVGVVILSEDFFMKTKWPMLELVAMVKEMNMDREFGCKIIPVFYSISLEEYCDPKSHGRWIKQWETWAKYDKRINIEEWKNALRVLRRINSVIKNQGRNEVKCRKEIVEAISHLVLPEIRWDDSHVITQKNYEKQHDSKADVRVVGLYGMGGIGKTTACKALCNDLVIQFKGRVCYIEFGSMSKVESLKEMLRRLTKTNHDILGQLNDEGQCLDLLKRHIDQERPVFLCLDNISDKPEFIRHATTYLKLGFAKGSVILVTARSLGELMCLNSNLHQSNCIIMPELEESEARTLFLNHAFSNKHAAAEVNNRPDLISSCVQRCYYLKGDGTFHYHPLALQVLGELLGCVGYDSRLWEEHLQKIDMFSAELSGNDHPVFSILRTSYDSLSPEVQMLFMDITLFVPSPDCYNVDWNLYDWLCMVHGLRVDEIIRQCTVQSAGTANMNCDNCYDLGLQLAYLNKNSLVDISEFGGRLSRIGVHDLWREFSVAEAKVGKLRDQRWVYLAKACPELGENSPSGRCWENLKRMCFINDGLMSLDELNLDFFCNVTVLKLDGELSLLDRAIDLGGLKNLKSLEVKNSCNRKLPDLSKLTSLRVACFRGNDKVDTITGLNSKLTNLRILNLAGCRSLRSVPGVNELIALEELNLSGCDRLEKLPSLGKLVNLRRLDIFNCDSMIRHLKTIDDLIYLEEVRAEYKKRKRFRHSHGRRRTLTTLVAPDGFSTGGFQRHLQYM